MEAYGFDVSEYAIGQVRADIKPYCWVGSATNSISKDYDLIICIEVCEHLSESDACDAVCQMTSHTDTILFSSTPSDFTEPTHVNVRPIIDWLRLFAQFSFAPEQAFDCSFIAPQAMLFRRMTVRPSDQALCRFANLRNQAMTGAEISALRHELRAKEATLNAILGSRGWKLLNAYRNLRFRVKHPIAQGILKLRKLTDRHVSYDRWIKHVEQRSYDPRRIVRSIANFQYKPKISIVLPVYNTPVELLDCAIRSVQKQHYENWELCICDDASPNAEVRDCLERWRKEDPRINVTFSAKNEGISGASNRALGLASGEFVGLLDHDDELSPFALYEVVKLLQDRPEADMVYSDEDKLDAEGRRVHPFFKPDWSPEYILACMYTCHFGVYRKRLLDQIGGFRAGFDGSQDYDLVLRLSESTDKIFHIPKMLYHWRMAPGSASTSGEAKPYAYVAAKRALSEHLERRQISGGIMDGPWPGTYRIRFDGGTEKISIVIVASGKSERLRACITSIEAKTSYSNYEVIVVGNHSVDPDMKRYLSARSHTLIPHPGGFNSSRLVNLGAKHARGAYLLLLHDDTEVISADWINSMLGFSRQGAIGAVGVKLLCRNGRVQEAGMLLGLRGVTELSFFDTTRNLSAVSAVCMMVRKRVFEEVGGFDEKLSGEYSDIDFCLKVREAGYRIVWTPSAEVYHDDLPLPGRQRRLREASYVKKRWEKIFRNDPYYNPNLAFGEEGFRISRRS